MHAEFCAIGFFRVIPLSDPIQSDVFQGEFRVHGGVFPMDVLLCNPMRCIAGHCQLYLTFVFF